MSDMRAITIRQPWASLIAAGAKTIETRPRPTKHRGLVLIHAGAATTFARPMRSSDFRTLTSLCVDRGGLACFCGHDGSAHDTSVGCLMACTCRRFMPDWPLGVIVATAQVVDCIPTDKVYPWADDDEHMNGQPLPADAGWVWADDEECNPAEGVLATRREARVGDLSGGRWALLLNAVRPLAEPVPCRGQQAVPWRVPEDVAAKVREQVEVAS